jgi:isoleucyl-tRNA synthetase
MDRLYQDLNLTSVESVHLTDFPKIKIANINSELEQQINTARTLTSLALSLRKKEQIKVRQPLQKMIIPVKNDKERKRIENSIEQLKSEINIKTVELLDDANSMLVKEIKPNFKTLGPRFGKDLKAVTQAISSLNTQEIQELEEQNSIEILINGAPVRLEVSDVEVFFKDIEGWQVAQNDKMTVALDMTITPELKKEGLARELINRVQNHRKDTGLEVTDKIDIYLKEEQELQAAVAENKSYILSETLANNLTFRPLMEDGFPLEFDNITTAIKIKKLKS